MSDTIRVWTLGAKAAARRPPATARPGRPRRPEDEPPHPLARRPQRLAVSGEISPELCSAALDRAKQRR